MSVDAHRDCEQQQHDKSQTCCHVYTHLGITFSSLIVSFVLVEFLSAFLLRERDHGGVRLPVHCEAFQDVQGPEVPLHADGVLPRWRALDHPQVHFL